MFNEFKPYPKPAKTLKKAKKPVKKYGKNFELATPSQILHLGFVKSQPCFICGRHAPSEAHHITVGGKRLGHYFTLPLCSNNEIIGYEGCHEGKGLSIGGNKKGFIEIYGTEKILLLKFWVKIGFDKNCLTTLTKRQRNFLEGEIVVDT